MAYSKSLKWLFADSESTKMSFAYRWEDHKIVKGRSVTRPPPPTETEASVAELLFRKNTYDYEREEREEHRRRMIKRLNSCDLHDHVYKIEHEGSTFYAGVAQVFKEKPLNGRHPQYPWFVYVGKALSHIGSVSDGFRVNVD
jgi:hypothetical protein